MVQDPKFAMCVTRSLFNYRIDVENGMKSDTDTTVDFLFLSMKHQLTMLARMAGWNTLLFATERFAHTPERIVRATASEVLNRGYNDDEEEAEDVIFNLKDLRLWRPSDMPFRIKKYSVGEKGL